MMVPEAWQQQSASRIQDRLVRFRSEGRGHGDDPIADDPYVGDPTVHLGAGDQHGQICAGSSAPIARAGRPASRSG